MTPDYVFPGSAARARREARHRGRPRARHPPAVRGDASSRLQLVDGLIKSGAAKTILFVGAEAHAGFMPWEDWDIVDGQADREATPEARARANEHRALAVLFGDGAGALDLPRDRSRRRPRRRRRSTPTAATPRRSTSPAAASARARTGRRRTSTSRRTSRGWTGASSSSSR